MCSKLNNHQLSIENYMHNMLHINLIYHKPIIDIQKVKRKEYKHNTKESYQTTRE